VGPGAGVHGGHIVATGTPDAIAAHPESLTGAYLSGRKMIPVPQHRRTPKSVITMRDVSTNNLQHVTVEVPLGVFVCVTGVSGSGKSSLVTSLLHSAHWSMRSDMHVRVQKITGHEKIDRCLVIDQTPIGRSPRSNAVTYTGVFDLIRDQFAQAHIARQRGYTKGRFSFNTKGGRCEACQGDGIIKIEMHFLPDVYVPCEVCKGSRYNRETLEVLWQGQTIADVLNMTVEAAREFFTNNERIVRVLDTLIDVGLGYITLGQSATTLSGGEAQRLKLAAELQRTRIAKRGQMHTLIVMDEPTTGLHAHDIARLLTVLQQLVDGGVSILVIEHQLDVIKCADWIIDVGPDGGASGGTIVATGTPEHIATVEASSTGQYLARTLARTCHPYAPHGTIQ
ncbi:MAG: ATP-binding cassette domain-containing protein, partial [Paenibacillaceae bacterium]|nr:ATP-binding cassette domain-containing protein [Paenibacillaceae bacterium]